MSHQETSNNPEYQELLEKYLRNELTEDECTQVEELLLFSEEARKELKRLETMFAIGRRVEFDTRQHTASSGNSNQPDLPFIHYFYRVAAVLILLFGAGIALSYIFSGPDISLSDRHEEPDWQQQYAEAYNPNPYLEEIIGDVLRGDSPRVYLRSPATDHRVSVAEEEAEYRFIFEGEVGGVDPDDLEIRLYSNETDDYIEDTPILSYPIDFDNASFHTVITPTLTPGLYYYTIEHLQTAEILAAGRIIVE